MLAELQKRASDAVEMSRSAGADDAWATATRSRSVQTTWRDGKVETVTESTSRGLRLQIWVGERYSVHSTTDLRPDRLKAFVKEAVAITRALQPDPFRKIPDPTLYQGRPTDDLDLVDRSLQSLTPQQRSDRAAEMDARTHTDSRVISASCDVADDHNLVASVSSNGFEGAREGTAVSLSAQVTVKDAGDKRPEGWHYTAARHLADTVAPGPVADEALRQALLRIGTTKGPTGRKTLVVDPRAGSRLIGAILGSASASAIQQGRSFWAGKLGQPLFGERLTLLDDPLLVRGLGSRHYDGEGISAKRMTVVEAGVVRNFFVDTYYGRKISMTPTTGGSSNTIVQVGKGGLAEHLAAVGSGIYVTSWLGGNSDPTTGDFSFGIKGHLIEGGKPGAPIGEMNVTGNLAALFRNLAAVGDDPWLPSSTRVPTLVFTDVEFSGA